jgi:type IV pilus assembly protein PilX
VSACAIGAGPPRQRQRGMVLIASLLLLLVVTLLALAMFRSMGINSKIAGNVREKQRAVHAAASAEQYAEYWLSTGSNSATVASVCSALANANLATTLIQICSGIPYGPSNTTLNTSLNFNPVAVPWTIGGAQIGYSYTPVGMNVGAAPSGQSAANYYASSPAFYISLLGPSDDGTGTVFQIDAVGYGGTADTVAVIESTYEVQSGVKNLGGP